MIRKRFYYNCKRNMEVATRFAKAYENKASLMDRGELLTPKRVKRFPDSIEFECVKADGLTREKIDSSTGYGRTKIRG